MEVKGRVDDMGASFRLRTGFQYVLADEETHEILCLLDGNRDGLGTSVGKSVSVQGEAAGRDPTGEHTVLKVESLK